ncbi:MAG: hypothetical protein IKH03_00655 [Oscillospiraceae bacterium]|nr:hypothetical protein [Oscillospiraceae bacterium]
METYPIIIDGALAGKLTVDRQGPRTAFDAECAMRPDLLRISVYGGGREGYLGLLAPEGERLTLHRLFSRSQLRDFPQEIERVERAGLPPEVPDAAAEAGEPEAPAEQREPEAAPAQEASEGVQMSKTAMEKEAPKPCPEPECVAEPDAQERRPETMPESDVQEPCPEPESPLEPDTSKSCPDPESKPEPQPADARAAQEQASSPEEEPLDWFASPDGALVCFDGVHSLIALPLGDERIPAGVPGEQREIEGREYLVYRTRDGRLEA